MTICSKCGVSFDYKFKKLPRYLECKVCGDKSQICYDCWCAFLLHRSEISEKYFTIEGVCNSCLRDKKIEEVFK
jgi:hypothetical protein